MTTARKITFEEAWDSSTVFFVSEQLEREIDDQVSDLLATGYDPRASESAEVTSANIAQYLAETPNGLEVILKDIQLSQEKFLRIVSLLRKLGRIPEPLDVEWSLAKIKAKIVADQHFAREVAHILVCGQNDPDLQRYVPRYYLERLNYGTVARLAATTRRIHFKNQLIGTYGARKGFYVENVIRGHLMDIERRHGIPHERGRSQLIDTDVDFAIPGVDDPWVIIMSSFQETTSSGQSTKARDMLTAFERVNRYNSRNMQNRVFVNFVDGGGWLARKRDFERLVQSCHYFLNLAHLDMLESIVLKHVPRR
jgi:hypothetical protein